MIRFSVLAVLLGLALSANAADISLLNVSLDPTRKFCQNFNATVAKYWKTKTGVAFGIKQSKNRFDQT
jgi:sulfate transport system substrate-binding protein